jgi:alkaline phosphatase
MKAIRYSAVVLVMLIFHSFAFGAKNVILIVPDGCSNAMWASIRAMTVGIDGALNIDRLPVQGRCRTYSADALVTDSAAAGTAYACGVKTRNGVLGRNAVTVRGDSTTGSPVPSVLELAEKAGYATGLVTTANILDATPGAFYTHRADRTWFDQIAGDLVQKNIEVLMGGGRSYMIPRGTKDEEGAASQRHDGRNIINEMKQKGYTYLFDSVGFNAVDPDKATRLFGIFNPVDMQYEINRSKDPAGEPPLWEMADKAIKILSKNRKGFFLLIEAGCIDHAGHAHLTNEFLWEGIACDKTVGVARDFALKNKDTLLIVVPDHATGGPSFVGMLNVARSDSAVVTDGFPRYTLRPDGFPLDDGGRPVAIQWAKTTGHTGEEVTVSAMGPDSKDLDGLIQNIDVFRVMCTHLGIAQSEKKTQDIGDIVDF